MISAEAQNNFLSSDGCLLIRFQKVTQRIPLHTILYIESNLRKLIIHCTLDTYHCYHKLDDIAEALADKGFIRCHQSYLLALNKVTAYTNLHAYIQDVKIPVSYRYQKIFHQKITEIFQKNYGFLACTKGTYTGSHIRICPEKEILIGRDGEQVDLVINLPLVSRIHCSILFHHSEMQYEVIDYSSNGTYVNGNRRLLPDEIYVLQPGCELCFGDKETVWQLG